MPQAAACSLVSLALAAVTIDRPTAIQNLIRSVRAQFPAMPIYVADQSRQKHLMRGLYEAHGARVLPMEFDAGVAASRNRLVATVTEEFFVLCDDDFLLRPYTDFAGALAILRADPEVGVVGGCLHDTSEAADYLRQWEVYFDYDPANRRLTSIPIYHYAPVASVLDGRPFYRCDAVMNFAVFRRSMFSDRIRWDERFKSNGEHEDFYLNLKQRGTVKVVYLPSMLAEHNQPGVYSRYQEQLRGRTQGWRLFMEKWGIDQYLELGFGARMIDDPGTVVDFETMRKRYAVPQLPPKRFHAPPAAVPDPGVHDFRNARLFVCYDATARAGSELVLWYREERSAGQAASLPRLAIRIRWFNACNEVLVWAGDSIELDLEPDYWQPFAVQVPLAPADSAWLRFEIVGDCERGSVPIGSGLLPNTGESTDRSAPAARHGVVPLTLMCAVEKKQPEKLPLQPRPGVTAVLTSCGRPDLLERTLDSFFRFNTWPLERMIVIEDGPADGNARLMRRFCEHRIEWMETGGRVGQIAAIDIAYSTVDTELIFHLEDDWEFCSAGFIEKSAAVLRADPRCLQVWIRALDDTNKHPLLPEIECVGGVQVRRLAYGHLGTWHGFSFNPGLRRTADYRRVGSYGQYVRFDANDRGTAESGLSRLYKDLNMHAVILAENDGRGYVRHIGEGRTVPP